MMGKKKEKITYIDDGRTIADMSGVRPGIPARRKGFGQQNARFRDVWKTYWSATKMMFLPMLVVVGCLIVIYLIMTLVFTLL